MKAGPRVYLITSIVLAMAGGSLLVELLVHHGVSDIAAAVAAAGWGLAAVVGFHLVPLVFDVLSWRALIPRQDRLPFGQLLLIRWIGDSVSAMLPVAQVGGEIVRVRLSAKRGMKLPVAAASVLVGMTVSVATQILFTVSGLGLLALVANGGGLIRNVLLGALIGVGAVGGFYAVQRFGMFRLIGLIISHLASSDSWKQLIDKGDALDQEIRALYARRAAVGMSCLWTMLNWCAGAVEVWIALRALGIHASYVHAYILESMGQGIRSIMFLVPGALGVQEGGYLVVGTALGLSSETALALALIRRVRELAFGIPGVVVAWQWLEGTFLWRRRDSSGPIERRVAPHQAS